MRSFGFGEPYVGRVNLVSGEVAEDFAMYYLESEQTPSLCALGTLVGEHILSAGGILIQAMPGCSEELLDALEIRAELFGAISQMLSEMTATSGDLQQTLMQDARSQLEELLRECISAVGKEPDNMKKNDRMRIIKMLYKRRAFTYQKSVAIVAEQLGVSRYTVYKYMHEIEEEEGGAAQE